MTDLFRYRYGKYAHVLPPSPTPYRRSRRTKVRALAIIGLQTATVKRAFRCDRVVWHSTHQGREAPVTIGAIGISRTVGSS